MPYPFDETFLTGIPPGFGAVGGAGSVVATWDSATPALRLTSQLAYNMYHLMWSPYLGNFYVEYDAEVVSALTPPAHFGFWLYTGVGSSEGYLTMLRLGNSIATGLISSTGAISQITNHVPGPNPAPGWRGVLRLDVNSNPGGLLRIRFSLDGVMAFEVDLPSFRAALLRPGIYTGGLTMLVRRIRAGYPGDIPDPPPAQAVCATAVDHAPACVVVKSDRPLVTPVRAIPAVPVKPPRGAGYLAGEFPGGITTVEGVPTPATVRVLYHPPSGRPGDGVVVAETLSLPDGTWRVDGLDPALKYDVVGRKDTYNDVIVAGVSPATD